MKQLCILLTVLSLALPLRAETDAAFHESQALRTEGMAEYKAGNSEKALEKFQAALALRPTNTVLLGYVAFLAAEAGKPGLAAEAAARYAKTGLAPGAGILGALSDALPAETWQKLQAEFTANIQPKGSVDVFAVVPDTIPLVEGIAADLAGTLYVSSVAAGKIYKQTAEGFTLLVDGQKHDLGSFFGIQYHAGRGTLLASYGRIDQSPKKTDTSYSYTGVAEFDTVTGALLSHTSFGGTSQFHHIADLTTGKNKTFWATEGRKNILYSAPNNDGEIPIPFPNAHNLQGVVQLQDGTLVIADYGRGLWHYDPSSGRKTLMQAPENTVLLGIDGLTLHKGKLMAIQNGTNPHRILEITLSEGTLASVTVRAQALEMFDEPTLGVSTPDGFLFVAASQWGKYGDGGTLKDGETAKPTPILLLRDE